MAACFNQSFKQFGFIEAMLDKHPSWHRRNWGLNGVMEK